jgi:poly-beta-1,6-N-acetyl-D-glucosamine synthase
VSASPARALRLIGGWPNRIGEDIVLTWRMLLQGGRSAFEPTAVAFTDAPSGWRAFARQRRRWARGMIE